jgi:hypothetical protein
MILSANEFVELRSSEDPDLYRRAAAEPAPMEVWLDVIARYPEYRRWVAHNKTIPDDIIRVLASDQDAEVRWTIAAKRRTPGDVLRVLGADPDASVRARVANNPKTPPALLRELCEDIDAAVRQAARGRLSDLD